MQRRTRAAVLAVVGLVLSAIPSAGNAVPVSATLSHPLQSGWATTLCGGFISYVCIVPAVDHDLTILMSDGSSLTFRADAESQPSIASLVSVRVGFSNTSGVGGSVVALRSDFSAYDQLAYELLIPANGDTLYEDLDFTPFEPAHYRYVDPTGTAHLLVGDGTGHFVNPVPEPGTAALVAAGCAALSCLRRRE